MENQLPRLGYRKCYGEGVNQALAPETPEIETLNKRFSIDEMTSLVRKASTWLRSPPKARYSLLPDPLPPDTAYIFGSGDEQVQWNEFRTEGTILRSKMLKDLEVAQKLINSGGLHPCWINLTPFAVCGPHLLFEVCHSDDFTDKIITGKLAHRFEPIYLLGPTMHTEWQEGDPPPRIRLPELHAFD